MNVFYFKIKFLDKIVPLFYRSVNSGYDVPLWPEVNLAYSDFNPNRLKTIFIIHGFASSANNTWLSELKDAYLQNVINIQLLVFFFAL